MLGEVMLQMALRMEEMSGNGGAASGAAGAESQPHLDLEDISHGGDMSTMLAALQQAAHAELLAQQQQEGQAGQETTQWRREKCVRQEKA